MSWWWMVPTALSALGAFSGKSSGASQNSSQLQWNNYNATAQRGVDLTNIASMGALSEINQEIAEFNAALSMSAGAFALGVSGIKADLAVDVAEYNAATIRAVTLYNDSLLQQEEELLWDALDLDLELMHQQRLRERGMIVGEQAASGTVIGEGSNADVVIDSLTQENIDAFIVRHNADLQVKAISNARAKGLWEGNMAYQRALYDGQISAVGHFLDGATQNFNSQLQALGFLAQGAVGAAESQVRMAAADATSKLAYDANLARGAMQYDQTDTANNNDFLKGLFNTAALGVSLYYGTKQTSPTGAGKSLLT